MTVKSKKRSIIANTFLNVSCFRMIYLCVMFFTSFCYLDVIFTVVKYIMIPWGLVLIYFYYIRPRRIKEIMHIKWLLSFLVASLFTILIHITDNFIQNIAIWFHIIISFFIIYGMHTERNKRRKRKELYIFALFTLIATTFAMILCFISLAFGRCDASFMWSKYHIVIYENRFTGIFTNPNLLAFYSVVAIVSAHILSKDDLYTECRKKRILKNWFLISCVIINMLGLFLSDSNGSILLITCYIIGNVFYYLFGSAKSIGIKRFIIKAVSSCIALVICMGGLLGLRICSNKAVSVVLSAGNAMVESNAINPEHKNEGIKENPPKNDGISEPEKSIVTFAHENENLDSGRIKLLQNAVVIFYNNPVFGVGKENITLYGDRLLEKGMKYNDLHNGYLTILVSYGLVGFIFFMGFAVSVVNRCIRSIFLEKKDLKISPYVCLFAFAFAYCIYSIIEKALLLEQSYMVIIFWYIIGYASCYMQKYDHINEKFSIRLLFSEKILGKADRHSIDNIDIPTNDD